MEIRTKVSLIWAVVGLAVILFYDTFMQCSCVCVELKTILTFVSEYPLENGNRPDIVDVSS